MCLPEEITHFTVRRVGEMTGVESDDACEDLLENVAVSVSSRARCTPTPGWGGKAEYVTTTSCATINSHHGAHMVPTAANA